MNSLSTQEKVKYVQRIDNKVKIPCRCKFNDMEVVVT